MSAPIVAVIPAAGIGSRMQSELPKQYLILQGKTVLEWSVSRVLAHPAVSQVIIALHPQDNYFAQLPLASDARVRTVVGGNERADSVLAALQQVEDSAWALVHDAARPCLHINDLNALIEQADDQGAILALPARDTIKLAHADNSIDTTLDRRRIWLAQTPQLFPAKALRQALSDALANQVLVTDEASAMEWAGYRPQLVAGRVDNLKITVPEDLALASWILQH